MKPGCEYFYLMESDLLVVWAPTPFSFNGASSRKFETPSEEPQFSLTHRLKFFCPPTVGFVFHRGLGADPFHAYLKSFVVASSKLWFPYIPGDLWQQEKEVTLCLAASAQIFVPTNISDQQRWEEDVQCWYFPGFCCLFLLDKPAVVILIILRGEGKKRKSLLSLLEVRHNV